MDVGPVWSVLNQSNNKNSESPRTSAPLPEAVWYQGTSSNDDDNEESSGFFVSLLQKWDLQDRNRVYYQVFPFPNAISKRLINNDEGTTSNDDDDDGIGNDIETTVLEPGPLYSLRLPRKLAIEEEEDQIEKEEVPPMISSPRMQERRVPLLARFSDNHKLLVLQFSPTHIRILKTDQVERIGNIFGPEPFHDAKSNYCKHWTVELLTTTTTKKDPYVPVSSAPDVLPTTTIRPSTANTTKETILPGGIFVLDQSYGNAADFHEFLVVLVTTKSVLCYKATLNLLCERLQGKLSVSLVHIYSHPQACSCCWTPKARILVVGSYKQGEVQKQDRPLLQVSDDKKHLSRHHQRLLLVTYFFGGNGPFATHNEIVRNPLLLPIRLERPPPTRLLPFEVGKPLVTSRSMNHQAMDTSSLLSTSTSIHKAIRYPVTGIAVVKLYKDFYIVELGAESIDMPSGKHLLDISIHRLDLENCQVNFGSLQQRAVVPKRVHTSKEDVLVTVLDNVLCITFRRSKFHLFLDILDAEADWASSYVTEKMVTEQERGLLEPPALFISPSFLFLPRRGEIVALKLNFGRLAPSIKKNRCNFSFLLRRKGDAASIALSRFTAVGALPHFQQRFQWINHVAAAYSRACSDCSGDDRQINPLLWDLEETMPLLFRCGLLESGSELLGLHDDNLSDANKDVNAAFLPKPVSHAVIFQRDILEHIFLPKAEKLLQGDKGKKNKAEAAQILRRIIEVAVSFMGALESNGCVACPALECFVFASLWRLGSAHEILAMRTSRSRFGYARHQVFFRTQKRRYRRALYSGIAQLSSMILIVIQNVEFGSLGFGDSSSSKWKPHGLHSILRLKITHHSLALLPSSLVSYYRYPGDLIRSLLMQKRLFDAMKVAAALLEACDVVADARGMAKRSTAALIYARRQNSGEDFAQVAIEYCIKCQYDEQRCRLGQSLYSFLCNWDHACTKHLLSLSRLLRLERVGGDDHVILRSGNHSRNISAKRRMSRRPSWAATSIIDKSLREETLSSSGEDAFIVSKVLSNPLVLQLL